ncbi:MAG: glycosyltransferase, partial [Clostridia bacterium]|nr:glycosyltransferase [Clostridia bacterium]
FNTDKPYIVMEGLVEQNRSKPLQHTDSVLKYIVYTGSLTKKYGIMDLVNAFLKIERENYRLLICGSGEAEQDILKIRDKRIIFRGAVSHDEALKCQAQATLLVNPRRGDEEFTKYSFPSKLMEYMVSGRPVLCFRLPGILQEYDEYLYYFQSGESLQMAKRMEEICEKPEKELSEIGEKAREFVISNKNKTIQAKRMMDMIFKEIRK